MKGKKNNSNYFDFGSYLDIYNYNNSGRRDLNKERKMAALKSAGDDSYKKYLNKFLSEMGKNIMNNRSSFQANQSNSAQNVNSGSSASNSSPTATSDPASFSITSGSASANASGTGVAGATGGSTGGGAAVTMGGNGGGGAGGATAGASAAAGSAGGSGGSGGGGGAGSAIAGPAIIASAKITSKIYDLINGLANYNKKEEPMYLGLGGNLFATEGEIDIDSATDSSSDSGSMGGFNMESIIKMFGSGNKQGQQQQQPGGMDLLGSIEKPTMAVVNDIAGIVNSAKAINVPYKKTTFNDVSTYEDLSRKFSEGPAKINKDYYQKIGTADFIGNNLREAAEGAEAFGAGGMWGAIGGAIGGGVTQFIRDGIYNWSTVPRAQKRAEQINKLAEEDFNKGVIGSMDFIESKNREDARNYVTNFARGGKMNKFIDGGNLNTNFTSGATEFNSGGTHEQNPNGGIPQGVDSNETPNYVEEGEVKWNNYIFSNRIVIDKDALQRFMLPRKYNGKTVADVSKGIKAELEERPNDVISKRGVDKSLERLIQAQEFMKLKEEAAKVGMSPEEYQQALIMQQQLEIQQQTGGQEQPVQQAQQEQPVVDEQQALLEEIMNEQSGNESAMMKLGGYLAGGGPLDGDPENKLTPISQEEVIGNWLKPEYPEYEVVQSTPTHSKMTKEQRYRADVERWNKESEERKLANAHTDQDKALQQEQIVADWFARTPIPNAFSFYSDMSPDEYSKLQELSSEERGEYIRAWNLKQAMSGRGSKNPELNQLLTSLIPAVGDIPDLKFFDPTDPIDYAAYAAGFLLPGTPGFFKKVFKSDFAKKLYKETRKLNLPKKETKQRVLEGLKKVDLEKIDNPAERDLILQDMFPDVTAKSKAGRKAAFEYALANPTDKNLKRNTRLAVQEATRGTPIPKGTPRSVIKEIKYDRMSPAQKIFSGAGKTMLGAAGLTAVPYGAAVINDAMDARYLGNTSDDQKELDLEYLFTYPDEIQEHAKRHGMSEEDLTRFVNYTHGDGTINESQRKDSARIANIYYETPTTTTIKIETRNLGREGYNKDEIIERLTNKYKGTGLDVKGIVNDVSKSNGNLWERIQVGSPLNGYKEFKAMGGFLFDQPIDSKKAGNYFSGEPREISFQDYLKKMGIAREDYYRFSSEEKERIKNGYNVRLSLDKEWNEYIKENGEESFPDFLLEFANEKINAEFSESNKTDEEINAEFDDMLGRAIPEAHKIALESLVNKQETNPNMEKFFTALKQNKDNDVNNAYRKAPIYNAIRNLLTQDPATGEYGEQIKSLYTPLIAENIGKHMGYTPIDFNQITSLQRAKQNAQIQNVMRNAGAAAPYLLAQINASRTGQEASNYIQGLEYNEKKKNEALQYNTNIDTANAAERARIAELNLANRNNLYFAGIQAIEEEKRAVEDTIAHNWNALAENLSLYGKENENFDIVKNNPGLLYGTKGDYKGYAYGGLLNKDNNKVYGSLDKMRAFMDMFDENIKKRKRS